MILPPPQSDRTWVPDRVNARVAQVYFDNDQSAEAPYAGPSNWYTGPPVKVRYTTIDVSDLCPVEDEGVQGDAPNLEVVQLSHAPFETVQGDAPAIAVVAVSHATVELQEDAGRACRCATVEDVTGVEDTTTIEGVVDVEDVAADKMIVDKDPPPLPVLQSLKEADDDTLESVACGALWVMTLISEMGPLPKKRKGSPRSDSDEDDIPLSQPVPLVREEAIHKNARMLNEIWGRQGLGPVDWKALASRISVPITLMELTSSIRHNTDLLRKYRTGSKLFGVPVRIYLGYQMGQMFDLSPGQAVADQGAEINLITRSFVLEHKIPAYDLGSIGFRGLQMVNADGRRCMVTHFVSMKLSRNMLILGLPWLYDVGAIIDIQKSELTLGLEERGDSRVTIKGLPVAMSDRQRIMLCPSDPSILEEYVGWDEDELSPAEDSSDSDEGSSDSGN
ncbi:hypothetical protein E4U15_006935 [Claviceps sp. LM218 group G6]|nr:hypothetical protein E4U15_006935 [Claviceps sp. LM218 group G6]